MKKLFIVLLLLLCLTAQGEQKPLLGRQINWAHPLSKGLVGYWLMNEGSGNKVYDLSGNNKTGVIDGAIWKPGKYGQGLLFDGSNDYIDCGYHNVHFPPQITVAILLKANSGIAQYDCALTRANQYGGGYRLWTRDSSSHKWYWEASSGSYAQSTAQISTTEWQFVVGTCGPDGTKLYINGVQDGSHANTTVAEGGVELAICAMRDAEGFQRYFPANVISALIYNRALSASEIALLYRELFCMLERTPIWMFRMVPAVGGGQVIIINMQ